MKNYMVILNDLLESFVFEVAENQDEKAARIRKNIMYGQDVLEELLPIISKSGVPKGVEREAVADLEGMARAGMIATRADLAKKMNKGFIESHPALTAALAAAVGIGSGIQVSKYIKGGSNDKRR